MALLRPSTILVDFTRETRQKSRNWSSFLAGVMFYLNHERERDFFIDTLLVRIHFIIVMIGWTGLASWEFQSSFPGSLTSTFLLYHERLLARCAAFEISTCPLAWKGYDSTFSLTTRWSLIL